MLLCVGGRTKMKIFYYKKAIIIGIVLLFFGASVLPNVISKEVVSSPSLTMVNFNGRNWTVDDEEGDANFTSIQAAIDDASDGDTIYVYSGYYPEAVTLSTRKELDIIGIAEEYGVNGSDVGKPQVDGLGNKNVFLLDYCENIELDGFEIFNSSLSSDFSGIWLKNCLECDILNNTVRNNQYGIYLLSCRQGNTIKNNNIYDCSLSGIVVKDSQSNFLIGNNVHHCDTNGIFLTNSFRTDIFENNISYNNRHGIIITAIPIFKFQWGFNNISFNIIEKNVLSCKQFFSFRNRWNRNWWGRPYHIKIIWCIPPIIDWKPLKSRP
jgi:parallel beta-helix repeat protein